MNSASAWAPINVALVKYWGKRDTGANLPATGSISMTFSKMGTRAEVRFDRALDKDRLEINGTAAPEGMLRRLSSFLDRVRARASVRCFASVRTETNVPVAAGLASSASAFAAISLAAAKAAGIDDRDEVVNLARLASGSAPRSLLGGFVELSPDGDDRIGVHQLAPENHWALRMVIARVESGPKHPGSSEGMERSRHTSTYYSAWLESHQADMESARNAIRERDIETLGRVVESSALKMHALTITSSPPFLYWRPATVELLQAVWEWRRSGRAVFATMDAGPHVKILCEQQDAEWACQACRAIDGIERVLVESPGAGARVLE